MAESTANREHRVVSADGTELVAAVEGQGPPLIFLPAGPGTSEASWRHVVPHLRDRFTCYLLDTRGRGLSADNPDHSPRRLGEDVRACAESIGEPAGLLGWGSTLALAVAAEVPGHISGVAMYEPGANEVMSPEMAGELEEVIGHVGEIVAGGDLPAAARALIQHSEFIYVDEDFAADAATSFWDEAAPNLPVFFQEQMAEAESEEPGPTDPAVLRTIEAPVLLLHGERSRQWFRDSAQHVATHVADGHVREIEGAGHFGTYTAADAVAAEVTRFFGATPAGA